MLMALLPQIDEVAKVIVFASCKGGTIIDIYGELMTCIDERRRKEQ